MAAWAGAVTDADVERLRTRHRETLAKLLRQCGYPDGVVKAGQLCIESHSFAKARSLDNYKQLFRQGLEAIRARKKNGKVDLDLAAIANLSALRDVKADVTLSEGHDAQPAASAVATTCSVAQERAADLLPIKNEMEDQGLCWATHCVRHVDDVAVVASLPTDRVPHYARHRQAATQRCIELWQKRLSRWERELASAMGRGTEGLEGRIRALQAAHKELAAKAGCMIKLLHVEMDALRCMLGGAPEAWATAQRGLVAVVSSQHVLLAEINRTQLTAQHVYGQTGGAGCSPAQATPVVGTSAAPCAPVVSPDRGTNGNQVAQAAELCSAPAMGHTVFSEATPPSSHQLHSNRSLPSRLPHGTVDGSSTQTPHTTAIGGYRMLERDGVPFIDVDSDNTGGEGRLVPLADLVDTFRSAKSCRPKEEPELQGDTPLGEWLGRAGRRKRRSCPAGDPDMDDVVTPRKRGRRLQASSDSDNCNIDAWEECPLHRHSTPQHKARLAYLCDCNQLVCRVCRGTVDHATCTQVPLKEAHRRARQVTAALLEEKKEAEKAKQAIEEQYNANAKEVEAQWAEDMERRRALLEEEGQRQKEQNLRMVETARSRAMGWVTDHLLVLDRFLRMGEEVEAMKHKPNPNTMVLYMDSLQRVKVTAQRVETGRTATHTYCWENMADGSLSQSGDGDDGTSSSSSA